MHFDRSGVMLRADLLLRTFWEPLIPHEVLTGKQGMVYFPEHPYQAPIRRVFQPEANWKCSMQVERTR
jgi:hypothetical protein